MKICVVGLGYVGLPLCVALARRYDLVGFDIDQDRVAEIAAGHDRTGEISEADLATTTAAFSHDAAALAGADVFIVTLPTPVTNDNKPDLRAVEGASRTETRVPFLDNDLVDFAMALSVSGKLDNLQNVVRVNENDPGKLRDYFQRTKDGKRLLRRAMRRHVPDVVTGREKQGFSGPDASWFRGESIDYVRDLLLSPRARIYDLLDRKTATDLISDHLEGRENRRLLVWSLLCLENWLDRFSGAGQKARA